MSPELIAFLRDWRAWVDRGAPEGEPYTRAGGLCVAVIHNKNARARRELHKLTGGRTLFGFANYWERFDAKTQHEDPARLAWVDAALAQAEQAE